MTSSCKTRYLLSSSWSSRAVGGYWAEYYGVGFISDIDYLYGSLSALPVRVPDYYITPNEWNIQQITIARTYLSLSKTIRCIGMHYRHSIFSLSGWSINSFWPSDATFWQRFRPLPKLQLTQDYCHPYHCNFTANAQDMLAILMIRDQHELRF